MAAPLSSSYDPTSSEGDALNSTTPRDFCNSFWGIGDNGPNILFSRMRTAAKTTEELKGFWEERARIEDEYAAQLSNLAKLSIGVDEVGELRTSLDVLRHETEKQAASHLELSSKIRTDLGSLTSDLQARQLSHKRLHQTPAERKFKVKQTQEAYVSKAREKYEADRIRASSYTQQANFSTDRMQAKIHRARQTVQADEKDVANFTKTLLDLLPDWETEWKTFCDRCQDLEEDRMDNLKDILWQYANEISTVCVADDESCERIRTALDQLEPDREVEHFVQEYGTGDQIPEPAEFVPGSPSHPPSPFGAIRRAQFMRTSMNPQLAVHHGAETLPPPPHQENGASASQSATPGVQQSSIQPSAGSNWRQGRDSVLPRPPDSALGQQIVNGVHPQSSPSVPQVSESSPADSEDAVPPILFYVKALYDYKATMDEEFDFQAGDVIAVTATPDDGWWSGELLDEARRQKGRHVFPSNFICLF